MSQGHQTRPRSGEKSERGASLIEFSLVLPLFLLLVVGAAEFGMAFRDWLSISHSTREAARVGSTVGDNVDADCFILEAGAGSLTAVPLDDLVEVWIFKADDDGDPTGVQQRYRPRDPADPPSILECNDGWVKLENGWPSSARNTAAGSLDLLGVRVVFDHQWVTGLLGSGSSTRWNDDTVMRLEPQSF